MEGLTRSQSQPNLNVMSSELFRAKPQGHRVRFDIGDAMPRSSSVFDIGSSGQYYSQFGDKQWAFATKVGLEPGLTQVPDPVTPRRPVYGWPPTGGMPPATQPYPGYKKPRKKRIIPKGRCSFLNFVCITWPLKIIRCLTVILIFAYWGWVVFSFADRGVVDKSAHTRRHGVVSKWVRHPRFEYDMLAPHADILEELTIDLTVYGAFISEKQQIKDYSDQDVWPKHVMAMSIVLERWFIDGEKTRNKMPDTDFEGGINSEMSNVKIVFVNRTWVHERSSLDYSRYPRHAKMALLRSNIPPSEVTNKTRMYAIGFSVPADLTESVPFSFQFLMDPITQRSRVLYGMTPFIVFVTFLLFEVNHVIAGLFALATMIAGFNKVGNEALQPTTVETVGKLFNYDYVMFLFSLSLFNTLLCETNVHSKLAFILNKYTRLSLLPCIIIINTIPGLLCLFLNNIFVAYLFMPFVIRYFELAGHNPVPAIMNLLLVCNLMGRAYVGTYASKLILDNTHMKTKIVEDDNYLLSDPRVLWRLMAPGALFVTAFLMPLYMVFIMVLRPYKFKRMRQIEENEQLMRLCDEVYGSIPDFSVDWHRVRMKILAMKGFFAHEMKEMRERVRKFGPEPNRGLGKYMLEREHQCGIHNWFLLIKMITVLIFYIVLLVPYSLHWDIKGITDFEMMRLGYIGVYTTLCMLLMVHSRDLEVLLKRIHWEAIICLGCITFCSKAFTEICRHIGDFLWRIYGHTMTGTRSQKVQITLLHITGMTAVSGVTNEYAIFESFLDTVMEYATFPHLNAFDSLLTMFFLATGYWGMASPVGTGPNLVAFSFIRSQGYAHKMSFFRWMMWGVPTAILAVFLAYCFCLMRVFSYTETRKPEGDENGPTTPGFGPPPDFGL